MSRQANPTLIGAFVLGAGALLVTAILLFGTFRIFSDEETFLIYFDESVNGLTVGAPVKFRGVPIGRVREIRLRYDQSEATTAVPVFIEIDLSYLRRTLGMADDLRDPDLLLRQIRSGLRAQLELVSFITGQYYIELDYLPDSPRPIFYQRSRTYKEIPSAPSPFAGIGQSASEILARFGTVDLGTISQELVAGLKRVNAALDSFQWAEINTRILALAAAVTERMEDPQLDATLAQMQETMATFRRLAETLETESTPALAEFRGLAAELRDTSAEMRALARQASVLLAPEGATRHELERFLRELADAAESLRVLTDFLERNPQAVITGR